MAMVEPKTLSACFAKAIGVWCVPGSPYVSVTGALLAIRHARDQEIDAEAAYLLIAKLTCSLVELKAKVLAAAAAPYAKIMGGAESLDGFHCNYGLAPRFEPAFAGSEIEFVARDAEGVVRVFCLASIPFSSARFSSLNAVRQRNVPRQIQAWLVHARSGVAE